MAAVYQLTKQAISKISPWLPYIAFSTRLYDAFIDIHESNWDACTVLFSSGSLALCLLHCWCLGEFDSTRNWLLVAPVAVLALARAYIFSHRVANDTMSCMPYIGLPFLIFDVFYPIWTTHGEMDMEHFFAVGALGLLFWCVWKLENGRNDVVLKVARWFLSWVLYREDILSGLYFSSFSRVVNEAANAVYEANDMISTAFFVGGMTLCLWKVAPRRSGNAAFVSRALWILFDALVVAFPRTTTAF